MLLIQREKQPSKLGSTKKQERHPGFRRDDARYIFCLSTGSRAVKVRPAHHITSHHITSHHVARSAAVTGKRAARKAGNRPPIRPMPSAHFRPVHNNSGETLNWNTTWLKFAPKVATL